MPFEYFFTSLAASPSFSEVEGHDKVASASVVYFPTMHPLNGPRRLFTRANNQDGVQTHVGDRKASIFIE